jgi:hypothetical protein
VRFARNLFIPLALLLLPNAFGGCDPVPVDDQRLDKRLFLPHGVIRGAVTYAGPRPCSQNGHIVGAAVVLVFNASNPPPPQGLANTAVNFTVVPGDLLFPNEVRNSGPNLFCPSDSTSTTVTAPFIVSPVDAGVYVMASFFDRSGRFLPTFGFRNLPEQGDLGGGYVDVSDAQKNAANPNYSPRFLPVTVGYPQATASGGTALVIPDEGFVADNVPVTIGLPLGYPRPYFYPEGADAAGTSTATPANASGDPAFTPVYTMTQDHAVLAPPPDPTNLAAVDALQKSFTSTVLHWGVPKGELTDATSQDGPFGLPLTPAPPGNGLRVWSMGTTLPENPLLQSVWPLVVFAKLDTDPTHASDPQSLRAQGSGAKPGAPIVIIQGITLNNDGFLGTLKGGPAKSPTDALAQKEHVTVLVRPSVLCLDPRNVAAGGTLATPHLTGKSSDPTVSAEQPLFDPTALMKANGLIRTVKQGCLPTGRYAINAVYPTGQAWTTPNEEGSCATLEGSVVPGSSSTAVRSCSKKPRAVLPSQGTRAVLEIIPPTTADGQKTCADHPVPPECLGTP